MLNSSSLKFKEKLVGLDLYSVLYLLAAAKRYNNDSQTVSSSGDKISPA
jgi:hypothetical protein